MNLIAKLAVWYLKRKNQSVLIGFTKKDDLLIPINKDVFIYKNDGLKVYIPKE